mmetsp:Transcript_17079/g.24160  ORF Transcript_17079/g.24160 Transcript_17079/m.24160 type:complete len:204 (+) Transcript_17079:460-1071(+)
MYSIIDGSSADSSPVFLAELLAGFQDRVFSSHSSFNISKIIFFFSGVSYGGRKLGGKKCVIFSLSTNSQIPELYSPGFASGFPSISHALVFSGFGPDSRHLSMAPWHFLKYPSRCSGDRNSALRKIVEWNAPGQKRLGNSKCLKSWLWMKRSAQFTGNGAFKLSKSGTEGSISNLISSSGGVSGFAITAVGNTSICGMRILPD